MIGTLFTLLATALSLLVVDLVVPGVDIATFPAALIAGLSIGLVNSSVKPVLSTLSMPLNFLSLGAFSLVVNGLCFWLASLFVPGFRVGGLVALILGPVILSFVNTFLSNYFAQKNPDLKIGGVQSTSDKIEAAKNNAEVKLDSARQKAEVKTEA
jgi:putative membrane protein